MMSEKSALHTDITWDRTYRVPNPCDVCEIPCDVYIRTSHAIAHTEYPTHVMYLKSHAMIAIPIDLELHKSHICIIHKLKFAYMYHT